MDNTGVPLWAFLLAAGLAVVGPFMTAWMTNTHSLKVLQKQHENEKETRAIERKYTVYDEVLKTLGRARYALLSKEKAQVFFSVEEAMTRLEMVGSEKVRKAARSAGARSMAYMADVPGKMGGMAYTGFMESIDNLAAAIREDIGEEGM